MKNNNFNNNKNTINVGRDNLGNAVLNSDIEADIEEFKKYLEERDVNREYKNLEELQSRLKIINPKDIALVLDMDTECLYNFSGLKGIYEKKARIIEQAIRTAEYENNDLFEKKNFYILVENEESKEIYLSKRQFQALKLMHNLSNKGLDAVFDFLIDQTIKENKWKNI